MHTLPVVCALRDPGPVTDRLRALLAGKHDGAAEPAEVMALLADTNGVAMAVEIATRYAQRPREELFGLPNGPGRRALASLVEHTLNPPPQLVLGADPSPVRLRTP